MHVVAALLPEAGLSAYPRALFSLLNKFVACNLMGVAPQRDFLLLAPAADDRTTEALTFDEVVALSHKVTGTRHPSVWSLVEPEDDPDSLPALIHWEDEGLWMLYLKAQAGEGVEFPLALVIVGYAPEA